VGNTGQRGFHGIQKGVWSSPAAAGGGATGDGDSTGAVAVGWGPAAG
jgi:hypothetical protein